MKKTTILTTGLLLTLASGAALAQPEPVSAEQLEPTAVVLDQEEPGAAAVAPRRVASSSPVVAVSTLRRVPVEPGPRRPAPLQDPARGRLGLFDTAETLGRGEWSFTTRGAVTTELALGVTDWLELGLKNIPVLLLVPEGGPQNTLYMGSARLRLLRTSWLTLTAEAEGVAFLGWAGYRAGMLSRLGGSRVGFHLGMSGMQLWGVSPDGWNVPRTYDNDEDDDKPRIRSMMVQTGVDLRVSRRVKLMAEASYLRQDGPGLLLAAPAVRLHGQHFAADFGVAVVHRFASQTGFLVPLVNLSVTY